MQPCKIFKKGAAIISAAALWGAFPSPLSFAANPGPETKSACTLPASEWVQAFDENAPRVEAVVIPSAVVTEGTTPADRRTELTLRMKGGMVQSLSAGGCDELELRVATERLPDGGTGMPPIYRMVWMLEETPARSPTATKALQDLLCPSEIAGGDPRLGDVI